MTLIAAATRYRWVALGVAFAGQLSNALASQSVAPLAPLFQPELGLSKAEVGLFSSATFFGAWGVLLLGGWLSDRLGVRKVMSIGEMACGVFLLAMTSVGSFLQAMVVMFLAGLGRGTVLPGTTKAVMEWFPPSSRATAMGVKLTGMPIGGILTASVLPALALTLGWRQAMGAVGLLVVIIGVATAILYRDARYLERPTKAPESARPALKLVLQDHRIWALSAVSLLFVAAQTSITTYLPLYFKEVALLSLVPDEATRIVAAGGYLALCQAGGVVGRVLWGVISDRLLHGRRTVLLAVMGVPTACISFLFAGMGADSPAWLLAVAVFACGTTAIGWTSLLQSAVCETAGARLAASSIGFSNTLSQVGLVGGPPLFGLLADITGSYRPAWLFLVCLTMAGSAVGAWCARKENPAA